VPFADLRAAGKSVGGSVNDSYLAARPALPALHEANGRAGAHDPDRHPDLGAQAGRLRGAAQDRLARLSAPVGTVDPRARIEEIRSLVLTARGEPATTRSELMSPVLARLPGSVIAQLAGPMNQGQRPAGQQRAGHPGELYLPARGSSGCTRTPRCPACARDDHAGQPRRLGCVGVNFDAASSPSRSCSCSACWTGSPRSSQLNGGQGPGRPTLTAPAAAPAASGDHPTGRAPGHLATVRDTVCGASARACPRTGAADSMTTR